MKSKIYKPALLVLIAIAAINTIAFGQDTTTVQRPSHEKSRDFGEKGFPFNMDNLNINLKMDINHLVNNILVQVNDIAPKINAITKDLNLDIEPNINLDLSNLNFNIDPKINLDLKDIADSSITYDQYQGNSDESRAMIDKLKSYSKSYPIDGNDKIKLNNQFGKITVNTWDRHEVKVDVQIKASAENDDEAQKLLDGVKINDSKDGDLVSFKTEIERNNGSWKIWGGKKNHKIEINYTVYMPAKTDLDVEQSYGAIQLPDLGGRVKISSSYGSVSAQNLSGSSNQIDVSYGSLKGGSINGAHLDCSYGSADVDECRDIKADLSYGSFKLGKLTGTAEFDLAYVGGFKIEEMANSFRKLNINSSYSSVGLGIPGNNNFDFDVTTTYGGFNYNDDKVTITSKTPPDGSKHMGPTRNYKGHFGKEGSEAQIKINADYGGVNFE
jgi:hypothetical protein